MKTFYEHINESRESDELSGLINVSIDKVDENLSYKDFAFAIATVLQDNYGSHNYEPFIDALHDALSTNEDYTPSGSQFSRDSDKFDASASDLEKTVHTTIYDIYEGHGPMTEKGMQIVDDMAEALVKKLRESGWITKTTQLAKKSGIV